MRYLILCGLLGAVACAERTPEPKIAPSSTSPGYAERFPADINALQRRFVEEDRQARELIQKFSGYPGALGSPIPPQASSVAKYADQEGRSAAYVERLERAEMVAAFYEEEKDEIRGTVSGAAQYAAKQKNCDADVGSPAAFALDKALEERLEESVHDASDAHALIDRDEKVLGKNAEVLRTQADEISKASYLSHVGVVRSKVRLAAMLEELDDVKKTLDRTSEDLSKMEGDSSLDDAQRKQIAEQKVAVSDARRRIDVERNGAQSLSESMEGRIEALQKDYEKAFSELSKALESGAPKAP
jgi:hypothetical protein